MKCIEIFGGFLPGLWGSFRGFEGPNLKNQVSKSSKFKHFESKFLQRNAVGTSILFEPPIQLLQNQANSKDMEEVRHTRLRSPALRLSQGSHTLK